MAPSSVRKMPLIYEDALTVAVALTTQLLQSTKMLNHTKISTVSSAIIVSLFVQFLFINYITGFMKDSKRERMMNNAFRRKTAEKNRKARDLYMIRGNNDVIHRERDVTGKQVSSSSPSPTPLPCPTNCICNYRQQWNLVLNCYRRTNAASLSHEINVYLTSVPWNLTKLSIEYTPLTAVPESICQLKWLNYLYLHGNKFITGLPDCITRLQELEHFTASRCRITSLQKGLFANLTKLRHVSLSDNHNISSIDAHVFDNLINLQRVYLYGNNISSINAQLFDSLINLQSVDLSHNQISAIDAHLFDNLINLQSVDLSHNQISSIDAHLFANLTNLQSVDLSHNQISSIDAHLFDVTANLPDLSDIDLSYNNLTDIDIWPVRRAQLIHGSHIDLSHNHISRFTNSLGWHYDCNSASLLSPRIDLSYNNIRHLNDLFGGWNITGCTSVFSSV